MAKPIIWTEPLPNCDFCAEGGLTEPAYYDGKTVYGPWANMCRGHLDLHGFVNSDELTFHRVPDKQ